MSTIYSLSTAADSRGTHREGTLRDARKLALTTREDVRLMHREGTAEYSADPYAGVVYSTRGTEWNRLDRLYGTYYSRGWRIKLRNLWRDTLGRVEFQSPIYIARKPHRG